jgi:hypothetical protein
MPQPHATVSGTRQAHHEPSAMRRMTFYFDPAPVEIDDPMNGGEPQS